MNPFFEDFVRSETRRQFFRKFGSFVGTAALASLWPQFARGASAPVPAAVKALGPHFAPKAKQIIYLHMVGGPPYGDK